MELPLKIVFGIIIFLIIFALVVYGLIQHGIISSFFDIFNIGESWLIKLFS